MQKVFLVYGGSDEDLGSELAVTLRASLPACELVGPWLSEYAGKQQAWLTSHAVIGLVTQASLQSAEVPFALGGADALEKPVFVVLGSDVAESTLSSGVPRDRVARFGDPHAVLALTGRVAETLGVPGPTVQCDSRTAARDGEPPSETPEGRLATAHSSGISYTEGWVSDSQQAWEHKPTDLAPPPEDDRKASEVVTALTPERRRSAKPTVPGRPTPIAEAQRAAATTTEDVIVEAFQEVEAEEAAREEAPADAADAGSVPVDSAPDTRITPTPGVPTIMVGNEAPPEPSSPLSSPTAWDAGSGAIALPQASASPEALPALKTPQTPAPVLEPTVPDEPMQQLTGEASEPTSAEGDEQQAWEASQDVTDLPDGPDAGTPRAIPTRSDVAPAPSVLAAAPGCEASLDAGRAFSDCVFHRAQGDALRSELEAPFGGFITSLGGNWETLRALDDVDLWMEMADNVLMVLPDDRQYVRWWYEVGFQLATLLNLAGVDPDSSVAHELDGTWESAMEALTTAVTALGMSAAEVAVLEGMLENLRGPDSERDYLNASRVQAVIRERATHADAALSA
ncbi:MAG: hypothetical protein OXU20_05760 [Myxococcales bacterium]|nr:hypothetical protein [Myxococcales bacterium]MDD9969998.1 hypothetical protein [Myxococcales bacterium]